MDAEKFLKEKPKETAEDFLKSKRPWEEGVSTITGKPYRSGLEEGSSLRAVGEDLQQNLPRYAGALAGGIVGAPGGLPGVMIGAGLGGAAGEAYKQIGMQAGMLDSDTTFKTFEQPPETSLEAAKEIGIAGAKSAAEEAVGYLGFKILGKVLKPFVKRITPEVQTAYNTLEKYMPKKTPALLPGEMVEARGLTTLQNVSESSLFGGQPIARYKAMREDAVGVMVDDLADSFGTQVDADVLGETITDLISTNFKSFKKSVTTPLYNKAEKLAGDATIDISTVKKAFAGHQFLDIGGKNAGDTFVNALNDLPDVVDFATAKELRSRLLDEVSEFKITNPNAKAVRVGQKIRNLVDKAINEQLPKEAKAAWREANKLYKKGVEKYNNRFLRRLIKKAEDEPEKVLNGIFKNGGIKGLRRTRAAVGGNAWDQLKGWYIRDVINKSTNKKGFVDGESLLARLYSKRGGMGKEALQQIFSKKEREQIRGVALALKHSQKKAESGGGGMLIQLTQAGAIVGLVSGQFPKASALVLMGPYAMSRIMLNPIASRWMTTGLKAPKLTTQVLSTATRLTTLSERLENALRKEKEKEE